MTDKDIFGWETSLNASYLKNKIIDLAGSDFIVGENYTSIGGGPIQIKKVGYPIGSFYLYEWANFNDQGANLYKHQSNGSLTTNPGADDLEMCIRDSQRSSSHVPASHVSADFLFFLSN